MSYLGIVEVPLPTLRALLDYQAEHATGYQLAELADLAIREWLQRQQAKTKPVAPAGYRWKNFFLPNGTRLRVVSSRGAHYADVIGGELVYEEQAMSPNRFVTASLGNIGNAWKLVFAQLPGENVWTQAQRLRYAAEAQARRTEKRRTEQTTPPTN